MSIWYVKKTGNDGGAGSSGDPFLTIGHAVSVSSPGDLVIVFVGTYNEALNDVIPSGTAGNVITLTINSGDVVTIRPPIGSGHGILITEQSYITIDGFVIDGQDVVTAEDGIKIESSGSSGTASHHINVLNCEIKNWKNQGVTIARWCHHIIFSTCNVHDNGPTVPSGNQNHGFYIRGSFNTVEYCNVHDQQSGTGIQIYIEAVSTEADTNVLRFNRVHHNSSRGITVNSSTHTEVYYNEIYKNNGGGISNRYWSPTGDKFYNNTVFDNGSDEGIFIDTGASGAFVRNNIVFSHGAGEIVDSGSGTTKDHNLETDPDFTDSASDDYTLLSTSDAIDTGTSLGFSEDIDGIPVPYNSTPDIGAHEFVDVVPVDPLQTCALVWYPYGYAAADGPAPFIGVYAEVDPADAVSAGVRMRVERCTGGGCSSFTFRGNSDGVLFPTDPNPQAEFIDTGVYGTIYGYRVRIENDAGVGPWSATIYIDTTVDGTSSCDSGVIEDLAEAVLESAERTEFEWTLEQVRLSGLRVQTEWGLNQVRESGLRVQTEYTINEVRESGLRIIYEFITSVETNLRVTKTVDDPTPMVGDNVTWTVLVENISSVDAHNVVLTDLLPAGLQYVSHTVSQGTYDPVTGIWLVGTLLHGDSATIDIVSQVLINTPITNIATATSDEPDSNPPDNTDEETITPEQEHVCPDLPLLLEFPENDADLEEKADTCQDEL